VPVIMIAFVPVLVIVIALVLVLVTVLLSFSSLTLGSVSLADPGRRCPNVALSEVGVPVVPMY
jgi:hypothetical protein